MGPDRGLPSADALGGDRLELAVLMLSVRRPKTDPERLCGVALLSS